MKKVIIIFLMFTSLFLLVSCKKETDSIFKDIDYEVELLNGQLVSGDDNMYEYYLSTKNGKKANLKITDFFEKDYLKNMYGDSYTKQLDDETYIHIVSYDGTAYNYKRYYNSTSEVSEEGTFKYLTYCESTYENVEDSICERRVGYALTNDETITYETILIQSLSSSITPSVLFENILLVGFYYYINDLMFSQNKIYSIHYKDAEENIKTYYSDSTILKTVVNTLNHLTWEKNSPEINISNQKNTISISMHRHLIYDKNGLMPKGYDFSLKYIFFLDDNIVMMDYTSLSSTVNNLYAKLTDQQMEEIKSIINEKLRKYYTKGRYQYSNYLSNRLYTVELLDEMQAKIYYQDLNPNPSSTDDLYLNPVIIEECEYTIEKSSESNNILVIQNGIYTYKFALTNKENKGIEYISSSSNAKIEFSNYVLEDNVFYYK